MFKLHNFVFFNRILKNNNKKYFNDENQNKNKLIIINSYKIKNKFIFLKKINIKKFYNNVWLYSDVNQLIYRNKNNMHFKKILSILSLHCFKYRGRFKYKIRYLLSFFSLILLENTIPLKSFFFFFFKYIPLKKHKKFMLKLMLFFKKFSLVLHRKKIQLKLNIRFKGRLGIQGNKKRVKYDFKFHPIDKYRAVKKWSHDGITGKTNSGCTFLYIKYSQLNHLK